MARALWQTNSADSTTTARIKSYETAERDESGRVTLVMLPSPEVLRRICATLGISWLSAFTFAGYYREVLKALAALVELAHRWLDQDGAFTREGARRSFRSAGVTQLGGKIVWDAMKEPRYADRYIEGCFTEWFPDNVANQIIDTSSKEVSNILTRYLESQPRISRRWCCVVPKPMAIAILVAASGFPLRGDIRKEGVDMYAVHLLESATPIIEHALRGSKAASTGSLLRADQALSDVNLPLDSRRVVAAEHMTAWADGICQDYTHYARLASMEYFGVAGCSIDHISPEAQFPQIRPAILPDVDAFRMTQSLD
jgi:hypothetical protein